MAPIFERELGSMEQKMFVRYRRSIKAWLAVSCAFLINAAPTRADAETGLQGCPSSPNCVSSSPATDADHSVVPWRIEGSPQAAWDALKKLLRSQERMLIVKETDVYVHAESRSLIFGFVDDVEFQLDAEKGLIQLRSASRIGYWDVGVNRRRVEALYQQLLKLGVVR